MNRASLSANAAVAYGKNIKLYANDYIIFKNDMQTYDVALSDFDVIRDATAECIALSNEMLSNDIVLSTAVDSKIFIDGISA